MQYIKNSEIEDKDKEDILVEIQDNKIYFYTDIEPKSILKLNKALRQLDAEHISNKQIRGLKELEPIYLYINSYGGDVFSGFSAMNTIEQCQSEIITVVDGMCASAATFLSVAGQQRWIQKDSYMLIHQMSTGLWGTYENFEDEKKNLDLLMARIRSVYIRYTQIPEKILYETLKHDFYFDAKTCLKYKLVDKII